jgi:hypothetical protein
MGAVGSSGTSVTFYLTTRLHMPEDSNFHIHSRDIQIVYIFFLLFGGNLAEVT